MMAATIINDSSNYPTHDGYIGGSDSNAQG